MALKEFENEVLADFIQVERLAGEMLGHGMEDPNATASSQQLDTNSLILHLLLCSLEKNEGFVWNTRTIRPNNKVREADEIV